MTTNIPVVLSIAGYDPSGASGILRDIKTFSKLGVYGVAVVTAITIQNMSEIRGVHFLSPKEVAAQIDTLLNEFPVRYVKVGMLGHGEIAEVVAKIIKDQELKAVVDPVLRSTSGVQLIDSPKSLVSLLKAAEIITPNVPEAEILSGIGIDGRESLIKAGKKIENKYGCVVIKGGHLSGEDFLFCGDMHSVKLDKLPYDVRGTGCSYSAAIAAFLARGYGIREAFVNAKMFLQKEIENSLSFGDGRVLP